MKVLLIHNYYGSSAPSGENTAFDEECQLLRDSGHDVRVVSQHSDRIIEGGLFGKIKAGMLVPWNPHAAAKVLRVAKEFDPDIVHVHNVFPTFSPAVFRALKDIRAAVVATLHNFRYVCASAMLSRERMPCTLCLDQRSVLPALRYRCYRNSLPDTVPLAISIALHRGLDTFNNFVDAFITLTPFQREKFLEAGFRESALHLRPPFYAAAPAPLPWSERRNAVTYLGRLGIEKGVDTLVAAWLNWGKDAPELDIIGDGPEAANLRKQAAASETGKNIRFLGSLSFQEAQQMLASSRLLVIPSRVFEGYPMVAREAFALGVPVIASNIGSLRSIIESGEVGARFEAGDPHSLAEVAKRVWTDPQTLNQLAAGARCKYERELSSATSIKRLETIYSAAHAAKQRRTNL
jgi:glycosyltransferase involved in cell wall biosynthesis